MRAESQNHKKTVAGRGNRWVAGCVAAWMVSLGCWSAVSAVAQDGTAATTEETAEAEGRWITGGATDEGFEIAPIPLPSFDGLEATVRQQLEQLSQSLEDAILKGEMSRNGLGELYGETGQVFHAYEFLDAAAPCYHNAGLLLPGDPRWPHLLGYVYQQKGDLDEARKHYGTTLEAGPSVATELRLVEVDLQDGHLEQAERRLQNVLKDQPEMLAAHALLAEVKLAQADFEAAISGFEAVLAQAPQANRYHYSLALAYRDNRNMEKAKYHMSQRGEVGLSLGDHLVEGLEDRKRGERVYLLRGRRAFAAGRFEEAAEAFALAVEAEPTSTRSRVNLGSALAQSGKPLEAVEQFRIVLELEPDNATAHYNLGHLLAGSDTPQAALPHFQFAADADAKDIDARILLATLHRRLSAPQKALALYEEILAIDPNHGEARFRQAATLVDLGQYAEGRVKLEEALVVLPQDGRLVTALTRLLVGSPDLEVRDGEKALEMARALWQAASDADHASLMAQAYGELGRCDEASAWQQVALDMAKTGQASEQLLASMQQQLEYFKQARPCRPPV